MRLGSLLAIILILASSVQAATPLRLSSEQQWRLDRGEVILLDVLPPGGAGNGLQGGTALGVVHASPETVWRVLVDYPRHAGLYPRVVGAEVLESEPARALVRYVVAVGPFSFGFHVNNYPDARHGRLAWHLAQERANDLFRENWGYWRIEPRPDGTMLTYAIASRTVLPAFLTRGAEREALVETLRAVRERAEGRV